MTQQTDEFPEPEYSAEELPHYHGCPRCKTRGNGFACFERDPVEANHREAMGIICEDCDEELAEAEPPDDRESVAPGDEHYYDPRGAVRVIPERIVDDRPGCTCLSYAEGGPHDPSCALEA